MKAKYRLARWSEHYCLPVVNAYRSVDVVMDKINDTLSSIEIYEQAKTGYKQIKDGAFAEASEPIHVIERTHFISEECLYDHSFEKIVINSIEDFEAGLLRDNNLFRLMPYKRCIVAF